LLSAVVEDQLRGQPHVKNFPAKVNLPPALFEKGVHFLTIDRVNIEKSVNILAKPTLTLGGQRKSSHSFTAVPIC
jgi:hypothetical protein